MNLASSGVPVSIGKKAERLQKGSRTYKFRIAKEDWCIKGEK